MIKAFRKLLACGWYTPSARIILEEANESFKFLLNFHCFDFFYQGIVGNWVRCNESLQYTMDVDSVLDVHKNLSSKGLQVLIYK